MKQSLYKSLALHFVVFLLIMVDIPLFWHNKTTLNQVPIIVDLNNVKISEMTNLPPKAKMGKEEKAASKVKRPRPSRNPSPNLNRKLKRSRNSRKKASLSWRIR